MSPYQNSQKHVNIIKYPHHLAAPFQVDWYSQPLNSTPPPLNTKKHRDLHIPKTSLSDPFFEHHRKGKIEIKNQYLHKSLAILYQWAIALHF